MAIKCKNITLIGMPGAGKTTVGKQLARALDFEFIDTDDLLVTELNSTLQQFMDVFGWRSLRDKESLVLMGLACSHSVIATGGSAVYSDLAMKHLCSLGEVVFLDIDLSEVRRRVRNFDTRGIAKPQTQSLEDMYLERRNLYLKYSTCHLDCAGLPPSSVCDRIISKCLSV